MSTNISKQKREDLIHKINTIRTFIANSQQDKNTGNLLNYLSDLEKDINGKKYGLIFEEHRENIDNLLDTHTPVLTEDKSLFIDNGGDMNFLIEGDNLAALQLLEKTHKGKIDVIYIDPPYNTGNNDFIYDDDYVDNEDLFKHSKWCSFMTNRLRLSKELLSDDGVIFISIDENENAPLKILCDDIYGAENYLSTIHLQVRYQDKSLTEEKAFKPVIEYIYIYAKNSQKFIPNRPQEEYTDEKFCYEIVELKKGNDFYVDGEKITVFKKDEWALVKHEESSDKLLKETWVSGTIYTKMSYGKVFQKVVEPRINIDGLSALYKVHGRGDDGLGYRYYTNPKRKTAKRGKMYSGMPSVRLDEIKNNGYSIRYLPIPTFYDYSADFGNINHEGNVTFNSGKKPVKLLKNIINISPKTDGIVLDFFAGSGSTGHAVMQLNEEDNGNRKYILCTNNQNNICRDITYKRLANVINGYGNNAPIKSSLKYYKVDYIPINEKMYYEYADELLKHVRELVELENGINFTHNEKIAIILTDNELSEFISNIDAFKNCETIYLGHDVLPSEEQEEAIKIHNINVNIIPDYYYRNLQEM